MHEQVTKEFGKRKYQNGRAQTPPFSVTDKLNPDKGTKQLWIQIRLPGAKAFRTKASASASLLNSLKKSKLGLRFQAHDSMKTLASIQLRTKITEGREGV